MKLLTALLILTLTTGCSSLTGPKETKEFKLSGSGGYRGEPVGSCSKRSASEICRELGWDGATDDYT